MHKGKVFYTEIQEEYMGKKLEHLVGEMLLERALMQEYGIDLQKEPRSRGEHGKPFLSLQPQIHYNISHSGKYVYCILATTEVGIDVQEHRKVDYAKLLGRMVTPEERQEILDTSEVKELFYHKWVLLEAYIKWTGEGMARDFRKIDLDQGWHYFFEPSEEYSGAVYAGVPIQLEWEKVNISLEK